MRKKYSHHDLLYSIKVFGYELIKYVLQKGIVDSFVIEYKDVKYGTGNQGDWEIIVRKKSDLLK